MKKYTLFLLILFVIFPLNIHAESVYIPLGFGSRAASYMRTNPIQYYSIEGDLAFCMDQHIPNPKLLTEKYVYYVGESSFTDGLIAMMNYNKSRGYNDGLYDAIRVFTADKQPKYTTDGVVINSSNLGSGSNHVAAVREFLAVANDAYYGDMTYLPSGSSSNEVEDSDFDIEIIDQTDKENITLQINFYSGKPSWFKLPSSCSSSNNALSCSIISGLDSNNRFRIKLSGQPKESGSATVTFNFDGTKITIKPSSMYNSVSIYECNGSKEECNASYSAIFGYQRFVVAGGESDSGGESVISGRTKQVTISGILGVCDSIDPSTLVEDSKEEDDYIKNCGPIVHLENDCGANSCDGSGSAYKAFSHSYVRRRSLKYIMLDLDAGLSSELTDYLDESINTYCGIYSTSKTDVFTPGTATAISGQFFVFNQYISSDYSNENTYFRQPYIVERVKSAFFFDYNKWLSAYRNALNTEESSYNNWQTAVRNVKSAYDEYVDAKNNTALAQRNIDNQSLTYCGTYDSSLKKTVYDSTKCYQRLSNAQSNETSAYNNWQSSLSEEKSAQNTYKTAVTRRTGLQDSRNTCMTKEQELRTSKDYNLDDSPDVKFTYSQTSKKEGKKSYTINMVDNTEKIKYWPNITSDDSISDYLGQNGAGLKKDTATQGISKHSLSELNSSVSSRSGVYLSSDTGETSSYRFPDVTHDNCSGGSQNCTTYNYTSHSFTSIQGSTSAIDPYGNVTPTNNETISKIYFYRPENATFALMNSGEYKTLDYQSNASYTNINGLEIGYVYNIELTAYKGQYSTSFTFDNLGFKSSDGKHPIQEIINEYIRSENLTEFESECNYCNMEMAFKRNCDICDPNDPESEDFVPQFYYRSISLADVTPNAREDDATNWSDTKGKAAKALIEQGSLYASLTNNKELNNNDYIALTDKLDINNDENNTKTYLADSSSTGKYDIYNDVSKEYLEYEVTLTPYDMKNIKRNNSRSYYNFSKMNLCNGTYNENPSISDDTVYCFECNSDMKECKSTFINAYFEKDITDRSRREKWKYFVNGKFCTGNINTCIKGIDYTEDGKYPDPLFTQQFISKYKNWP